MIHNAMSSRHVGLGASANRRYGFGNVGYRIVSLNRPKRLMLLKIDWANFILKSYQLSRT